MGVSGLEASIAGGDRGGRGGATSTPDGGGTASADLSEDGLGPAALDYAFPVRLALGDGHRRGEGEGAQQSENQQAEDGVCVGHGEEVSR